MIVDRPRRSIVRGLLGLSVGLLVAGFLSGCEALSKGAMKVDSQGVVLVAVCSKEDATTLVGTTYPASSNGSYQDTVWAATGRALIQPGEVITFGVAPEGMTTGMPLEQAKAKAANVVLTINVTQGRFWLLGAARKDLREDKWRDQDGQYRDTPCPPQ